MLSIRVFSLNTKVFEMVWQPKFPPPVTLLNIYKILSLLLEIRKNKPIIWGRSEFK